MKKSYSELAEENKFSSSLLIMALLFKHKVFIILTTVIITVASIFYSLNVDVYYLSVVSAVPPKSSGSAFESAIGNISSALKDFGLKSLKGGGGGEDDYTYMVMLTSRTLIDSVINKYKLKKRYDLEDKKIEKVRKAFIKNYMPNVEEDGNYTISIWDTNADTAAIIANDIFYIANGLAEEIHQSETQHNLKYIENRLQTIDNRIAILGDSLNKYSKKYLVFSIEDQAKEFSKMLSELKIEEQSLELSYKMSKSLYGENDYTTKMKKDLLDNISSKVNQLQDNKGYIGNFSLKNMSKVGLEFMLLKTELETFTKFKAILMPTYEKAKLDMVARQRNLFIVDEAISAEKKDKPKRAVIVIGAFLASFVLSIMIILFIDSFKSFKRKYKQLEQSI